MSLDWLSISFHQRSNTLWRWQHELSVAMQRHWAAMVRAVLPGWIGRQWNLLTGAIWDEAQGDVKEAWEDLYVCEECGL
eukprot:2461409-Amphidinium_carterae.1